MPVENLASTPQENPSTQSPSSVVHLGHMPCFYVFDYALDRYLMDAATCHLLGLTYTGDWVPSSTVDNHINIVESEDYFNVLFTREHGDQILQSVRVKQGQYAGEIVYMSGSVIQRDDTGIALVVSGYFSRILVNFAEYVAKIKNHSSSFDYDVGADEIHYGPAYREILGLQEDEQLPLSLSDFEKNLLHPDDLPIFYKLHEVIENPNLGYYFESIFRLKHRGGFYLWCINRGVVVERNHEGRATRLIGSLTNIDVLRSNFERLKRSMYQDPLTGLHNRLYLNTRYKYFTMEESQPLTLVYADVSGLKLINDYLGHASGDTLVKLAAQILKEDIPLDHEVIRLSGDEFLLIFTACPTVKCRLFINRFSALLSERNRYQEFPVPVFFGFGIATLYEIGKEDTFLRCEARADARLQEYKKAYHDYIYGALRYFLENTLGQRIDLTDKRRLSYLQDEQNAAGHKTNAQELMVLDEDAWCIPSGSGSLLFSSLESAKSAVAPQHGTTSALDSVLSTLQNSSSTISDPQNALDEAFNASSSSSSSQLTNAQSEEQVSSDDADNNLQVQDAWSDNLDSELVEEAEQALALEDEFTRKESERIPEDLMSFSGIKLSSEQSTNTTEGFLVRKSQDDAPENSQQVLEQDEIPHSSTEWEARMCPVSLFAQDGFEPTFTGQDTGIRRSIDVKEVQNINSLNLGYWCYRGTDHKFLLDRQAADYFGVQDTELWIPEEKILSHITQFNVKRFRKVMTSIEMGSIIFEHLNMTHAKYQGAPFIINGSVLSRLPDNKVQYAVGYITKVNHSLAEVIAHEIAGDGFFTWDSKSNCLHFSSATHYLHGYGNRDFNCSFDEWIRDIVHPDDIEIVNVERHIFQTPDFGDNFEFCVRLTQRNGNYIWSISRGIVLKRDESGQATNIMGTLSNINLVRDNFDNIKQLLYTDTLTGLHNRSYFKHHMALWQDAKMLPLSVIYADVTGLKITNDVLGHADGDALLLEVTEALRNVLDDSCDIMRLSGDEFLVIMPHCDRSTSQGRVDELLDYLYEHNKQQNVMPLFVGFGRATMGEMTNDTLHACIERADVRMQAFKEEHRTESYSKLQQYLEMRKGRPVSMRDSRRVDYFTPEERAKMAKKNGSAPKSPY